MNNNKKNGNSFRYPIGMCMGLAIGTAIGAATHNIALWMPIGLCLGLALGHHSEEDDVNDPADK